MHCICEFANAFALKRETGRVSLLVLFLFVHNSTSKLAEGQFTGAAAPRFFFYTSECAHRFFGPNRREGE